MERQSELERRMISEAPGLQVQDEENGRTVIRGYAALYNSRSQNLGGFVETITPGAFDDVMRSNPDVFGRYNHDRLLARTSSGTMKLELDERGLRYTIYPKHADSDVVESISRGDVRGSSFAFQVRGDGEKWYKDKDGTMVRELRSIAMLADAGPVDNPAYPATEAFVSKRALEIAAGEIEEPAEHPVLAEPPDDSGEAEKRAAPDELSEGDFVQWDSSGGMSQGRVEHVMTDGNLDVPGADVVITASEDDPAVLITVFEEDGEGWEPTDVQVGHKASTLTKIDPLPAPGPSEDDEMSSRAVNMKPTAGMASAARRGLELHEKGLSGDGLKPETVARANRLARREEMNRDWIVEMNAWFKRHEASKTAGWDEPPDYSPAYVAWLLWGGNAAMNWSARKVAEMERESESNRANNIAAELRAAVAISKLQTHLHRAS